MTPGIFNLTISKEGFQNENLLFEIEEPGIYQNDFALHPNEDQSLVINDELTAFAEEISESPQNVFTLSGLVNINDILYFDGELTIDKRPGLANPEISGNCGFYANNIAKGEIYQIKQGSSQFKYYATDNSFLPQSLNYLLNAEFLIGGFNVIIGEIIIDLNGDFVEIKSIARMPFPINMVTDNLLEEFSQNLPIFVNKMSGNRIFSKENGLQTAVDISGISVNIGIVSLEDVNLYWNTDTQTYGGGFKLNIPGNKKPGKLETDSLYAYPELKNLPVELRDENQQTLDSLSFDEFLMMYRSKGFTLLSVGAQIEFVQGSINKIIVSIGTKVPIGPTGLFLTEITGGLEDLATKNWKIIANVDISLGVEVPVLGSPVKLNDFGVRIQPWEEFTGSGEFQVFDQTISDGSVSYNRPLSSLSAECNLNLADILKGRTTLNLVGGQINGSGLLSIQTPGDLPWILFWAENKNIGSAQAELNNQFFQSAVELRWINLAQRMEFGKPVFPWFHFYLGKNLNKLHNVWKGDKNGKQAIIFQVPENSSQLVIVAMDTINPTSFDFSIQSPNGQIIDQTNAHHYELDDLHHQTIMSVLDPIEGDWYFLADYADDIALHTSAINQKPTTLINEPQLKKSRSNQISLSFNDFSDTLNIQVYYDNNNKGFDGTMIDQFLLVNNGNLEFVWQNDHVPNGEYYIY